MPSDTITALRKKLRDQFPSAHRSSVAQPTPTTATSSQAEHKTATAIEHSPLNPERFPKGAITEISPAHPSCGLSLIIATLLSQQESSPLETHGTSAPFVLIDARDRFDPSSFSPEQCARLLWLRCHDTRQALHAADLLLRDGNLPLVLLDLSALPPRELRRIPTSSWHRLRQLTESTGSSLLALTPSPLIPRTALRLTLSRQLTLSDLTLSRTQLLEQLETQTTRQLHHSRTA